MNKIESSFKYVLESLMSGEETYSNLTRFLRAPSRDVLRGYRAKVDFLQKVLDETDGELVDILDPPRNNNSLIRGSDMPDSADGSEVFPLIRPHPSSLIHSSVGNQVRSRLK